MQWVPRSTRSGHWFATYWHWIHTPESRSVEECDTSFTLFPGLFTLHVRSKNRVAWKGVKGVYTAMVKTHLRSGIEWTLIVHSLSTWVETDRNTFHSSYEKSCHKLNMNDKEKRSIKTDLKCRAPLWSKQIDMIRYAFLRVRHFSTRCP